MDSGVDSGLDSGGFVFSSLGDTGVMAGLELARLARLVLNVNPTSLSQELGLQVCATKPRAEASFRMGLKNWQKFS